MNHPGRIFRSAARTPRAALAAAIASFAFAALQASTPQFFRAATQDDFLKGEMQNLALDSRGELTLGPAQEPVYEGASPFLWTLLPAPDGSLFLGSGNDGRVFHIDPQGRGSIFWDGSELEVHALAAAPGGGLYAGTSPNGKVYRIDRTGMASVFFDPDDTYIWALATDQAGNVYAATGGKGIVYKIDANGRGAPFFRTKATHATALAFDRAGNLLVATGSPGRVFRVDTAGRGFLVLDTPFEEVHSLRLDATGNLYVAALNGRSSTATSSASSDDADDAGGDRSTTQPARAPIPTVTTEVTAVVVADSSDSVATGTRSTRDDNRAVRGAVYRVAPDGLWDRMWESRDDAPYDVALDPQNRVVIATGNDGKVYRLDGNPPRATLLARAPADQVTALYADAKGVLYYATSNPGKVMRVNAGLATRGTYKSDVRDADMVATWGNISWRATTPDGTRIEVSTRSGNSATPDETWSEWSAPYTQASGSPIASPKARYLQWRAVLAGGPASPVLTSVSAAYLQRNVRPQVRAITVYPPGIVFQKPFSTGDPDLAGFDNQTTPERKLAAAAAQSGSASSATLGRRTYQKGLQTLAWRAADENDDELRYDVEYRRAGDPGWTLLQQDLRETILAWDTTTVPNGTYVVRVRASDAPSNGSTAALVGELDSMAFDIDNTPPAFRGVTTKLDAGRAVVTFEVTDDQSAVEKVECSRDGRQWWTVFPIDGLADSRSERYEVVIPEGIGPGGLSLRAIDAMNNVATAHVERF